MSPAAHNRTSDAYALWVHKDAPIDRRGLLTAFVVFTAALMALFLAATPNLFQNLVSPPKRYAIYGTCLEGGCGLRQRSGPGPAFAEVDSRQRLHDGTQVRVICQADGDPPKGFTSRIWNRLVSGRYVSDVFVDTPNRDGGFSRGIPRCNVPSRAASG